MANFLKLGECIYESFGVARDATIEVITKQYRKLALKFHPDRHNGKPDAVISEFKKKFQSMSYIYGILSNCDRRALYDQSGNVSDAIDDGISNFDEYFSNLYKSCVTPETIEKFKYEYQGSVEERCDLLEAYKRHFGNMDLIIEDIPCSSVEEDEERFRTILQKAIDEKLIATSEVFTNEPIEKRDARRVNAAQEAIEAAELAKELGVGGDKSIDDLASIIMARQKARQEGFNTLLEKFDAKCGAEETAVVPVENNIHSTITPSETEVSTPILLDSKEIVEEAMNLDENKIAEAVEETEKNDEDVNSSSVATDSLEQNQDLNKKTPRIYGKRMKSKANETPLSELRRSSRQAEQKNKIAQIQPQGVTPIKRKSSAPASASKRVKKM